MIKTTPPTIIKAFKNELRRVLYDQAISVVTQLHFAEAGWDSRAMLSNRDEFWRLYWGDLVFVESDSFAKAMIAVRNKFEKAKGGKPEALEDAIKLLAKSYEGDIHSWPRLPDELLPKKDEPQAGLRNRQTVPFAGIKLVLAPIWRRATNADGDRLQSPTSRSARWVKTVCETSYPEDVTVKVKSCIF